MRKNGVVVVLGLCLGMAASAPAAKQQEFGEVQVTTVPDRANVYFDGQMQNPSPVSFTASPGQHLLVVRKEGFSEARRTVIVSQAQKAEVEIALGPVIGLVLIHSTPMGADVEIDGANRGKTPLLITDLSLGQYRVRFSKSGCLPMEKVLAVTDRNPQKLSANLRSDSGTLTCTSKPDGAQVSVNGAIRGQTPCTIPGIAAGTSEVVFTRDGYRPNKQSVVLRTGEEVSVHAIMEPLPGSLEVHSVPDGAFVYVNNQRRGKTPLKLDNLDPAEYRVRAELQGYETLARTVIIKLSETSVEEFRLERNSGSLEVITQPAGVTVYVDGQRKGLSKAPHGGSDAVSEPLLIEPVAPGEHSVKLIKKGYEETTAVVTVARDKTATLNPTLKRLFIPDIVIRTGPGPADIHTGRLNVHFENGDLSIELKPGIFRVFRKSEILSAKPLMVDELNVGGDDQKTDTKTDHKSDAKSDTKSDAKSDTKVDAQPDTKADSKVDPKAVPKTVPKAEPAAEPRPEPK